MISLLDSPPPVDLLLEGGPLSLVLRKVETEENRHEIMCFLCENHALKQGCGRCGKPFCERHLGVEHGKHVCLFCQQSWASTSTDVTAGGLLSQEQVMRGQDMRMEVTHELRNAVKFPGYCEAQSREPKPCGYSSKLAFRPTGPFDRTCPMVQLTYSERKGRNVCSGAGLGSPAFVFPGRLVLPISPVFEKVKAFTDEAGKKVDLPAVMSSVRNALRPREGDVCRQKEIIAEVTAPLRDAAAAAAGEWLRLLHDDPAISLPLVALKKTHDQPFRLELLAWLAHAVGDPDAEFPLYIQDGVHLGDEHPIPDSGLWPLPKHKKDKAEERCSELTMGGKNYASWAEYRELAQKKVDAEAELGFVVGPFQWKDICKELALPCTEPPRTQDFFPSLEVTENVSTGAKRLSPRAFAKEDSRVPPMATDGDVRGLASSPLGAVMEDPAREKLRVVMDGTGAGVNGQCKLPERQETPSIYDVMSGLRPGMPSWVGLKIDVEAAFKSIKVKRTEWKKTLFYTEKGWYYCPKLPFGMRASGYWWIRLNGLIHRVVQYVVSEFDHGAFMYVDDSLWLFREDIADLAMSRIFTILSAIGVPISWGKTQVGSMVDWVGYMINFETRKVTLSPEKVQKFRDLYARVSNAQALYVNEVESIVGKLAWASVLCPLSKALLFPIFKAIHSPEVKGKGKINDVQSVKMALHFWMRLFELVPYLEPEVTQQVSADYVFRVDACANQNGAFLGGWIAPVEDCKNGILTNVEWFSCDVPVTVFPDKKDNSAFLISACEMLALVVGLRLWGSKLKGSLVNAAILAKSDSMVTVKACLKGYAKSKNLAFVLREVCGVLSENQVGFRVDHIPGVTNVLADGLSRRYPKVLSLLDPAKQAQVKIQDLFKEAMLYFEDQDFDPFVGVCVGNAKNPGPSRSTSLADCWKPKEEQKEFFALFCQQVGIETLGEWKRLKIEPKSFVKDLCREKWVVDGGVPEDLLNLFVVTLNSKMITDSVHQFTHRPGGKTSAKESPAPPAPPPSPLGRESCGEEPGFRVFDVPAQGAKKRSYPPRGS